MRGRVRLALGARERVVVAVWAPCRSGPAAACGALGNAGARRRPTRGSPRQRRRRLCESRGRMHLTEGR